MFNITPSEFLIIALLALVVLGPERLPEVARSLGKLINKARSLTSDLRESVDSISDDPVMKPLKDLGELATRPRQKLAEFAAEAEAEERADRLAREREEMDREQAELTRAEHAATEAGEPAADDAAEQTATEAVEPATNDASDGTPTDDVDAGEPSTGEAAAPAPSLDAQPDGEGE